MPSTRSQLSNLPVSYVDVVTMVKRVAGLPEKLPLPIIPCPVLGPLPDDEAYVWRVGVVEEYVKYLLSYGGVYRVPAPLRTPHVQGGVFDVPDRAVGVGGGYWVPREPIWIFVESV